MAKMTRNEIILWYMAFCQVIYEIGDFEFLRLAQDYEKSLTKAEIARVISYGSFWRDNEIDGVTFETMCDGPFECKN